MAEAGVPAEESTGLRIPVLVFFCALMLAYAELGAWLSQGNLGFSTVWPPSGLYYTALTFAPNQKKDWPALFLFAAIANVLTDFVLHESSILVTLFFILSNSMGAMMAAAVARRTLTQEQSLNGLRDMFVYLACGLLIQAPMAATAGLWLQSTFWHQSWTWLKWVSWWSANAIGLTCFGVVSLFALQKASQILLARAKLGSHIVARWKPLGGHHSELLGLWAALSVSSALVYHSLIPLWGLFVVNILFLMWAYRFGILHSSFALAAGCVVLIYHATSNWQDLIPFSEILLIKPDSTDEVSKIVTVASVQLFLIERAVVINLASALFTELFLKQRALAEAAESREQLMARMSHEIRTPLSGVLGLIEAWAMTERSEQRAHDLRMILNSASQLKRVIDDVLDFSKLSAGKLAVSPVRCRARELFSEIVALHASDAQRKGIALEFKIADECPDDIVVDSLRLRQIINNLIANAIKFTQHGYVRMTVDVLTGATDGNPVLSVKVEDSGIGISQTAIKRLFQPFEQLGRETTRIYGGTGLGLVISRELAELMGGSIHAKSTPGKGSCFTMNIPFEIPKLSSVCDVVDGGLVDASAAPVAKKNQVILVVEDDPINQIVAKRFLEAEGYTVRIVGSGKDAIAAMAENKNQFSLVLMDYFMPNMDGCEVTRHFRAHELAHGHGKHLPIIGLTASVLAADHQRCRLAGMDDVLLKPIDREALRAALKKYVTV